LGYGPVAASLNEAPSRFFGSAGLLGRVALVV